MKPGSTSSHIQRAGKAQGILLTYSVGSVYTAVSSLRPWSTTITIGAESHLGTLCSLHLSLGYLVPDERLPRYVHVTYQRGGGSSRILGS
jgi:hypothetical protein